MGTNYYIIDENIHIGKRSCLEGYSTFIFSSDLLSSFTIEELRDFLEPYQDMNDMYEIVDEYGQEMTKAAFATLVNGDKFDIQHGDFC